MMHENLAFPSAYGRTAEIYAWQNGQVLKLFYDWFGRRMACKLASAFFPWVHANVVGVLLRKFSFVHGIYGKPRKNTC